MYHIICKPKILSKLGMNRVKPIKQIKIRLISMISTILCLQFDMEEF